MRKPREDTSISLAPLTFEEAIAALVHAPTREDSPAEESGSTKEGVSVSEPSKRQTSRRQKCSGDSA